MLSTSILERVFIHDDNGTDIKLSDPGIKLTPQAVMNFYANTYPILTTAQIEGPEIVDDCLQYKFVTTIGTKG